MIMCSRDAPVFVDYQRRGGLVSKYIRYHLFTRLGISELNPWYKEDGRLGRREQILSEDCKGLSSFPAYSHAITSSLRWDG